MGKGDFLPPGGQFTVRSACGELMRAARIERPDALYDASVAALTVEDVETDVENPIVFGEFDEANATEGRGIYRTRLSG